MKKKRQEKYTETTEKQLKHSGMFQQIGFIFRQNNNNIFLSH